MEFIISSKGNIIADYNFEKNLFSVRNHSQYTGGILSLSFPGILFVKPNNSLYISAIETSIKTIRDTIVSDKDYEMTAVRNELYKMKAVINMLLDNFDDNAKMDAINNTIVDYMNNGLFDVVELLEDNVVISEDIEARLIDGEKTVAMMISLPKGEMKFNTVKNLNH